MQGGKEIMGEQSRKGWREKRLTSEAAAGAFGSVYLFFPVSSVASLTAGVQASGFTSCAPCSSCVCEQGRRRRTTSSPLISLHSPLPSFTHTQALCTCQQPCTFSRQGFHQKKVSTMPATMMMKPVIVGAALPCL